MPDSNADGRTRVYIVPAVANQSAPTTTELNAGVRVDTFMTPDGLVGFEPDTADVDNTKLSSTFNTNTPGRISYSGTMLRFHKQTGSDTIYNTYVYGFSGFVVVRRDIDAATAWASAQACEVYPIACGERRNLPPEQNATHKFEVPTKITAQPTTGAAVA